MKNILLKINKFSKSKKIKVLKKLNLTLNNISQKIYKNNESNIYKLIKNNKIKV